MSNNKKAFSMLMTLLVIIVFSLIVILGLKISSLQLEARKYSTPMMQAIDAWDNLSSIFVKILKDEKECIQNASMKYNEQYEMKANIAYTPTCTPEIAGNNTIQMQMIINMKLFDKKNDIYYNRVLHAKQ